MNAEASSLVTNLLEQSPTNTVTEILLECEPEGDHSWIVEQVTEGIPEWGPFHVDHFTGSRTLGRPSGLALRGHREADGQIALFGVRPRRLRLAFGHERRSRATEAGGRAPDRHG